VTDNMSLTKELRVSLTEDDHAFLNVVALGAKEEMQSIARRLIREFLDAKRHEATVIANYLKAEVIAAESRRKDGGTP
jgi:hypothetical protein